MEEKYIERMICTDCGSADVWWLAHRFKYRCCNCGCFTEGKTEKVPRYVFAPVTEYPDDGKALFRENYLSFQ